MRTTDHRQATGKLYHLRLRVECILFCNLQIQALTYSVLEIGLYELLGNPTTYLIEPPGPDLWYIKAYISNYVFSVRVVFLK